MATLYERFVSFIDNLLSIVDKFLILPTTTDIDKYHLNIVKFMLIGKEVEEIKFELSQTVIKRETLDKIENLYNDIFDYVVDKTNFNLFWKEFWKQLYRLKNRL